MNWLSKLERKYSKYAIPNLTLYLIICFAFGYVFQMMDNKLQIGIMNYLTLNPYAILHGQIWRLVSWILVPSEPLGIFTLIMLYFYYSIGNTLERTWGTFRYNVYMISGFLFTILGAFLLYGICALTGLNAAVSSLGSPNVAYDYMALSFSTYYVCMSIILAFAATFPDVQVLLMFVIPLKIKVLGIVYAIILGVQLLTSAMTCVQYFSQGSLYGYVELANCIAIIFSMLSFVIFFVTTRKNFRSPGQIKRQNEYKKKMVRPQISKHKCAICGRTSDEYPDLEFRFCSKCVGNYEYCNDHIFTHKHVTK